VEGLDKIYKTKKLIFIMNKVGVFLESGGNKVFFVNGVLRMLKEHNFKINHLVGLSSSSAILFAHKFNCHNEILKIFGDRLKNNSKNFYFRGDSFPQNNIYESSIKDMFKQFSCRDKKEISYRIIASQTSMKFKKLKGISSTVAMFLEERGVDCIKMLNKIFNINSVFIDSNSKITRNCLISVIMGSSTIYPAIKLHLLGNKLILEGKLAKINPVDMLSNFDKRIIVHTKKGKTKIKDDILHVYSSKDIPNNILDYTSKKPIEELHKNGENEVIDNLGLIKEYFD
jgi:hypothetical protein